MPFKVEKRGSKYCVVTTDSGKVHGCHETRTQAVRQQRALYVHVPEARRASAMTEKQRMEFAQWVMNGAPGGLEVIPEAERLTAAVSAPVKPPRAFFDRSEPDAPTPMTYEESGEVYGHLALWESCHRGFMGGAYTECVKPPRSLTDYGQFHLGHIETAEGDKVAIGKITFDTDHAPLTADVVAASRHYDNTGSVGAYVRATNGKLGIWLSGALRSDLSSTDLVSLRANPLSGDWRSLNHNLELVASLAVPVPGFPITRSQLALAASADGGLEVSALILPSPTMEELEEEELVAALTPEQQYARRKLGYRIRAGSRPHPGPSES